MPQKKKKGRGGETRGWKEPDKEKRVSKVAPPDTPGGGYKTDRKVHVKTRIASQKKENPQGPGGTKGIREKRLRSKVSDLNDQVMNSKYIPSDLKGKKQKKRNG